MGKPQPEEPQRTQRAQRGNHAETRRNGVRRERKRVPAASNGVPNISWKPDLNEGEQKTERTYVVEGKPGMLDEWGATNAASRFFRVKMALP